MDPASPVTRAWQAYYKRYPTPAMRQAARQHEREEAELERWKRDDERGGVPWSAS